MYDFNDKPELNITPLVDIMLVLLAILMVTAPVIEFEEPIQLPVGSKSKQVQDFQKIDIIITKDRIVTLNKNKVEIDRSVFKKDTLEKLALKKAKKEYLLTNGTPDYVKEVNKTILIMEANPMICGNLIFKK